jgi:hypothetical protein
MNLKRIVTSYLRRKASYEMPAQIPSSLAAIDPKVDPKGWAAELIQVIKKAFNLKGMVGKVKPTINKTGFIIDFTKYGSINLVGTNTWPTRVMFTHPDGGYGFSSDIVQSPEDLYQKVRAFLAFVPLVRKAEDYAEAFLKASGLAWKTNIWVKREEVYLRVNSAPGSTDEGFLVGNLDKTTGAETWELEWPGQAAQTFTSFEEVLDFIPEEFDDEGSLFIDPKKFKITQKNLKAIFKARNNVTINIPVWKAGGKNSITIKSDRKSSNLWEDYIAAHNQVNWDMTISLRLYHKDLKTPMTEYDLEFIEFKQLLMSTGFDFSVIIGNEKLSAVGVALITLSSWDEVLEALKNIRSKLDAASGPKGIIS